MIIMDKHAGEDRGKMDGFRWSYFPGRKSVVGHLLIRNMQFGTGVAGGLAAGIRNACSLPLPVRVNGEQLIGEKGKA
jgi:hypothetical protein